MRISRNIFKANRPSAGPSTSTPPACRFSAGWLGKLLLPALLVAGCSTAPVAPVKPSVPDAVALPAIRKPLKIGLALGGGAARGFAHVGVIAVLEEAGLRPQMVVGTSAGSLVAAIYATGKTSAQLQQTALGMEEVAMTDWMLPIIGKGVFRGDALGRYVNQLVGAA